MVPHPHTGFLLANQSKLELLNSGREGSSLSARYLRQTS
jgi:hypothetical protein